MPLPLLAIAAAGFATGGGLEGIIGGGKRRREEGDAARQQAQAESDYFNFDFNQDVGPIKNIYAEQTQQQQEYLTAQTQQAGANALRAAQNQQGGFGATQAILQQQTRAAQQNNLQIGKLQQAGAQFVENQRLQRIQTKYDQAGTLLGRADSRLAAAKKARQIAQQKIFQGIGAGVTAAAGGSAGIGAGEDGKFDWAAGLKGSGLIPAQVGSGEQLGNTLNSLQKKEDDIYLMSIQVEDFKI